MSKKICKPKFDWKGFFQLLGIGILLFAFGYFLIWAIFTAPDNSKPSEILGFRPMLRFVREIPTEISEKIAYSLAGLFCIFGVFIFLNALYRLLLFIIRNLNKS